MDNNVWIKVSGVQFTEEGTAEPIEMITEGQYSCKNGKHYLRYREVTDEEGGVTLNTVVIDPDSVDILKRGIASTSMFFHKDRKTVSIYHTPFGGLTLGLDTRAIELSEAPGLLSVEVDYGLELNNRFLADCHISIAVNEKASHISL